MTVNAFYESSGNVGDWKMREKIERAVMVNRKISWKDEMTDEVCGHIVNAFEEK